MPSSYATLGDATGSILGTLLGGGDAVENAKYGALGADAAASAVGARKASVETQKILDEIERERKAASITGRDIARAQGMDPRLYDKYAQGIDTGSYGVPVSAAGPIDTSRPPAELTPEIMRQFKQADLTHLAKQMSGGADTNASAIMDTLLKGGDLARTSDVDMGQMTPESLAILEAAQGGNNLVEEQRIAQQNADTSEYSARKATDKGNYIAAKARAEGLTQDQAWAKYGGQTAGGDEITMADVNSAMSIALPGLNTQKYAALLMGPGGKQAADAYMAQSVSEMQDPANSLSVIKQFVPDPARAEPAVQSLIMMLEAQIAQGGASPSSAEGQPPGRVVVDYTQPGVR